MKICSISDCRNKVQAKSLCVKHYRAFHRWKQKDPENKLSPYIVSESLRKKRPPIGAAL